LDLNGRALISLYHRPDGRLEDYEFTQGSEEYANEPFVQSVLTAVVDERGDKFIGVVETVRGFYFYVAGPLHDEQGELLAVILIGKSVPDMIRTIREELLTHVTLYSPAGEVIGTTFLDTPLLAPDDATDILSNEGEESLLRSMEITGIRYREIIGPWEARQVEYLGLMGLSYSENFLIRLNERTWFRLLFFIAIAFLFVFVIGNVIANQISQPILSLNKAAAQVAGGDLNVSVLSHGDDEIAHLTQEFNSMVSNLQRSKLDLVTAYDKTLEGWAKALELRDGDTMGHSQRVTELTVRLAKRLFIPNDQLIQIQRGALIHDIGKMAIPDHILLKPGPLTEVEWDIMRQHPTFAVQMLGGIPFLQPALDIPACHHERWDGSGYPRGLKGEEIPLSARIFAIVDVWDALRSDRPYRSALAMQDVFDTITSMSGKHFDPKIVDAFIVMMTKSNYLSIPGE
jgi:HD-GYP domain-containing protein (c-di-GMP phosphodiesterase class II)